MFFDRDLGIRPFRAPHHTASAAALVGGGSDPRPGEVSLAHHGVLFLDELPEWDRRVLEVLREPLESGVIHISRAARQSIFPAQFQFVAAMNPCPCGWLGHACGRCHCSPEQIARYRGRVSGPLLDRIDLGIDVPAVPAEALAIGVNAQSGTRCEHRDQRGCESASCVGERIANRAARQTQLATHAARSRSALRDRQHGAALLAQAMATIIAVGARVSPHSESGANDCRSCRCRHGSRAACCEAIGYRRFDRM
jgi:magnesium chelatase family protein